MSNQENNNINVEKIMQEIKAEIIKKGYTNDMLSFNDIVVDTSNMNTTKFDKIAFNEEIYSVNHSWNVQAYRVISGSAVAVFVKKVIRKMVYFFVEPIVLEQDGFNASVVRLMNQLNVYVDETKAENEELKKTIEELSEKIKVLEQK